MGKKKKRNRIVTRTIIIFFLLFSMVFLFVNVKFRSILVLKRKLRDLTDKIILLKEENQRLKEKISKAKRNIDEYIEMLARRELGLIKLNEMKFKFIHLTKDTYRKK